MANMSYCRFENTSRDLRDCLDALRQETLEDFEREASEYEKTARRHLISLAIEIAEEFADEVGAEINVVKESTEVSS